MPAPTTNIQSSREYPTGERVRRLLALAGRFRTDFLLSVFLGLVLLLLGLLGLQLLGVVIDVIRHALDSSQTAPNYPFGWRPPTTWTVLQIVTALALAIVAQSVLRADGCCLVLACFAEKSKLESFTNTNHRLVVCFR